VRQLNVDVHVNVRVALVCLLRVYLLSTRTTSFWEVPSAQELSWQKNCPSCRHLAHTRSTAPSE
jgi:hypothetical protein